MSTVTVDEAEANISRMLADVEAGQEFVISRGAHPIAKLVPIEPSSKQKRVPGMLKGLITIGPQFFEPLSEEELKLWEGDDNH